MKLTEEQIKSAMSRLKMKLCPICFEKDRSKFIVSENLTSIPMYKPTESGSMNAIPYDVIESYSVVCSQCGCIQQFSKSLLDQFEPDLNDPLE